MQHSLCCLLVFAVLKPISVSNPSFFSWEFLEGAGATAGPCPAQAHKNRRNHLGFGSDTGNLLMNMPLLVVRCQQQLMCLRFLWFELEDVAF